jgi:hypothetical protein
MRTHLMNTANLDELEQRFADPGIDGYPRAPANPAHQPDVAHATSCTPAEYRALEAETRRQILAHLDQWKAEEDAKGEAILTACIRAGQESARLKGLNQTCSPC